MMAIFESARRRARIDLPLQEQGYPLDAIVEEAARTPSGHAVPAGAGTAR
jgi:hypothetical protein